MRQRTRREEPIRRTHLTTRASEEMIHRIDNLAAAMAETAEAQGLPSTVTQADAVRAVMVAGLPLLEERFNVGRRDASAPARGADHREGPQSSGIFQAPMVTPPAPVTVVGPSVPERPSTTAPRQEGDTRREVPQSSGVFQAPAPPPTATGRGARKKRSAG
jgi:hypothetical protein